MAFLYRFGTNVSLYFGIRASTAAQLEADIFARSSQNSYSSVLLVGKNL